MDNKRIANGLRGMIRALQMPGSAVGMAYPDQRIRAFSTEEKREHPEQRGAIPPGTNDGRTSGTFESPVHSYLDAGTYHVTLTVNGTSVAEYDVEAAGYDLSVSITDISCDDGNTATATVTGGETPYTYLWDDEQTTATATNLSTGNHWVTVTDANGCFITVSAEILVCCTVPDEPTVENETFPFTDSALETALGVTGTTGAWFITDQLFAVNYTWTITDNLTLDNCEIVLGEEAQIIVADGVTLTITSTTENEHSHLHSCDVLWGRIHVESGAHIVINENTLIEDAYIGVLIENATANTYEIENSTFNKNFNHIYISYVNSLVPGTITNCDFLCDGQLNDNSLDFHTTFAGIFIRRGSSNSRVTVGTTLTDQGNLFNNANFGIIDFNVNLYSLQNTFEDIQPNENCSNTYSGQAGIYSCGSCIFTHSVDNLYVEGQNVFKDSRIGVYSYYGKNNVEVDYNTFDNVIHGILVRNAKHPNKHIKIIHNTMTDVVQGVYCLKNPRADIDIGTSVYMNTIGVTPADLFGIDYGLGILVQETQALVNTDIHIENNTITGAPLGIGTTNTWMNNEIRGNTITVHDNGGGTPAGIVADNSTWSGIFGNSISSGNFTEENKSGIRVSNGVGNWIACNTTDNIGTGLDFQGALQPSFVLKNQMIDHHIGILLMDGTLGNIGAAGTTPVAWDNTWEGDEWGETEGNPHTYARDCNAQGYSIFYREDDPNGIFEPVFNDADVVGEEFTRPLTGTSNDLFEFDVCPDGVGVHGLLGSGDLKNMVIAVLTDTTTKPIFHDELTWQNKLGIYLLTMENDSLLADSLITVFYDSCFTSNMGKLVRANEALSGWHLVSEMGWYENSAETMEEYLDTLQNITTAITPEDALKDVMVIALQKHLDTETVTDSISYQLNSVLQILFPDSTFEALEIKNDAYSTAQIEDLTEIAEQCPYEYGQAVYMARAMLSELDTIPYLYKNECEIFDGGSGKWDGEENEEEETIAQENERIIKVYPNPANESMFVEINLKEKESAVLEMWSVTGAKIKNVKIGSIKQEISLTELSSGVFYYSINIKQEKVYSGKQIIIR